MSDTFSLDGKNAVVTGLSGGIGQAIAATLAREGANVAGDYLSDSEGAADDARSIEAQGREALIIQGDTGDEAHIRRLADETVARWGSLDIWVNNAAALMVRDFFETTTERLARACCGQPARLLLRLQGRRRTDAWPGTPAASSTSPPKSDVQAISGLSAYITAKGGVGGLDQGPGARAGPVRHHRQRRRPGGHRDTPQRGRPIPTRCAPTTTSASAWVASGCPRRSPTWSPSWPRTHPAT